MVINNNKNKLLNSPAYLTTSPISIEGQPGKRLMVVYRTKGCEYAKNTGGCTMCDFSFYACPAIAEENIQAQHSQSLAMLSSGEFSHFDLLTLGNFFNDREVSPELREHLLKPLSKICALKRVLIESRREYLTLEKLKQAKSCLRKDQVLEFALGYESSNEYIRNKVLNKSVPERCLDEALQICKEAGVNFVAYVLIKPHTLTEAEGIEDAVNTAVHVLTKANKYNLKARIAFEPVFVAKGKIIEELFKKKEYIPPKLWSISEVLIATANKIGVKNTEGKLFVGLSDENLSENRMTSNHCSCDDEIRSEIQAFNSHQDVAQLMQLYHECKGDWMKEIGGK